MPVTLIRSVRVLDFDGSVVAQENLLERYHPLIIDLADLGPRARFWMDIRTKRRIQERLGDCAKGAVTFLGSGDFHHVSHVLIDPIDEPVCALVFDAHPDWDILPPRLHCGSWVTETLKKGNVLKVILAGACSKDISTFWIQSGNLKSLQNDRLEIYPYRHKPTRVFCRNVPQNISIRTQRGRLSSKIFWTQMEGVNLEEFFG